MSGRLFFASRGRWERDNWRKQASPLRIAREVAIGTFVKRVLALTFTFNRRNDGDVFIETVRRLCGFKPLRFADLTSDPESASVPF